MQKKKPTLNYKQMSLFHAGVIKKKRNPNFKGDMKQTYSSFIIKMLDETPINFNKSIKKISNTTYKNLFKRKTGFNPFNTNYSPSKKRNTTTFERALNRIEKETDKKNEFLKFYKNKYSVESIDHGYIFHKFKEDNDKKNKSNNNSSGHNFNFENSPSPMKEKQKIKNSLKNLKKKRLNQLYGYDSNFIKSKNYLLKKKDLFELGNYQNEVLKISQRNLSKDYMMKLFTELQFIRRDADLVKPLPPINYRALVTHCFKGDEEIKKTKTKESKEIKESKEVKKNNNDKKTANKKVPKEMDEYEKELDDIKKNNKFKREKTTRNKRMYKIYEILPEYVVDALYKKRNKEINF